MAFLVPVLVFGIILLCCRIWPFGEECALRTDMYHQYAPFFAEFRRKLVGGGSLAYTWNLGLGVNFTAIMAYYLANPLNWLVVLFPEENVIEFMTLLIIFKTGFCGVCMSYYLLRHEPDQGLAALLFGICYALSGYVCAYYWNLMWFDAVAVFPVVVLGAEELIRGRSGLLYGLSLGFCILSNYYISILICIFLVLYFFAYNILCAPEDGREFLKRGMRFAVWSLLAGGLAAMLLLPEIYALQATASGKVVFPKVYKEYFSVLKMLARHMAGVTTEQGLDHWPNIYCGTAIYLLMGLYFISRRIKLREKAVYAVLALFFLMSFSIDILNFLWHGLHYPNSLPARQSFIYVFLVLFMGFRIFCERRSIRRRELGGCLMGVFAFILLAQEFTEEKHFHFLVFYGALLFSALYALLLHLYLKRRLEPVAAGALTLILLIGELSVNTAVTSLSTTSRTAYTKDNADVRTLLRNIEDDSFYRVEKKSRKTKNDGAWLGFRSVSLFSSMANRECSALFEKLGCEASTNAYSITGSTPLIDMLFSVKYALYNTDPGEGEGREKIAESGDVCLYRNLYTLPLGFLMPKAMTEDWMLELDDPTLVQNSLCDQLGVPQVLKPLNYRGSVEKGTCSITIPQDGEYYAFVRNTKAEGVTVNWPDRKKTFDNINRRYLVELGDCREGDLVRITSEKNNVDPDVQFYRFDYKALGRLCEILGKSPFRLTSFTDSSLEGDITVNTGESGYSINRGMMFMSIPYDEGWKVKVDGEPVMIYKGLDTFLSFYLSDGEHHIEMRYEPRGLKAGLAVTAGSFGCMLASAAWLLLKRRKASQAAVQEALTAEETEGEDT